MTTRHATRVAFALLCAVALLVGVTSPSVATAGDHDGTTELPEDASIVTDASLVSFDGSAVAVTHGVDSTGPDVVNLELAAPATTTSPRTVGTSDDSIESESRREIYETASRRPGVHLAAVSDTIDQPASTVRYHVRVLEREGRLETRRIHGKRRLFPSEVDRERYELHAALSDPPTAELLSTVARLEPVGLSTLAETTDRSQSTVSHHLDRLREASLVEYERDGRSAKVRTSESVSEFLETPTGSAAETE